LGLVNNPAKKYIDYSFGKYKIFEIEQQREICRYRREKYKPPLRKRPGRGSYQSPHPEIYQYGKEHHQHIFWLSSGVKQQTRGKQKVISRFSARAVIIYKQRNGQEKNDKRD
jgi:hypothetical protein